MSAAPPRSRRGTPIASIRLVSSSDTTTATPAVTVRAWPATATDVRNSPATATTVGASTTSSACDVIVASTSGAMRAVRDTRIMPRTSIAEPATLGQRPASTR
ncbi:MAG: hypothetical protein GEU97_12140 [Actinophytocola sp.]|nr:hypothetical protein [Actinophytocola sp.]